MSITFAQEHGAEVYNGFRLDHCPRQLVSFATLTDSDGAEIILEYEGEDHVAGICRAVDDWQMERAADAAIAALREPVAGRMA